MKEIQIKLTENQWHTLFRALSFYTAHSANCEECRFDLEAVAKSAVDLCKQVGEKSDWDPDLIEIKHTTRQRGEA